MYNADYFFVDNPLNRYTLSPRDHVGDQSRRFDRSLHPGRLPWRGQGSNWLPAPKDRFTLMLRLYWPNGTKPSILDGTWHIPPVKEVA